ncbi:BMC domain-containing protein [Oenococcus oeni]
MQSIGYLEVIGLSGAIVAADQMLKTADVSLKYLENTKGGGLITVSVIGDIAAVEAAIDAGKTTLKDKVVTTTVIANPAEGIDDLGSSDAIKKKRLDPPNNLANFQIQNEPQSNGSLADSILPGSLDTDKKKINSVRTIQSGHKHPELVSDHLVESETVDKSRNEDTVPQSPTIVVTNKKVTCNLCGDPKCPRKLGEPHNKCIHYGENEVKK